MTTLRARIDARIAASREAFLAQIEDSWLPRAATVMTVMIAVVGAVASDAAGPIDGVVALLLVPVGNWLSWRRRRADNRLIKLAIVVAVAFILSRFFGQLRGIGSVEDAREPLTNLFIGVQVLHAYDLPRRRDLSFTVAASLALTVMAANGVRAGWFGALMIAWLVAGWLSLWLLRLSAAHQLAGATLTWEHLAGRRGERTAAPSTRRRGPAARAAALVLLAVVAFLGVPRPEPSRAIAFPFRSLTPGIPGGVGVLNPGLPASSGDGTGAFDPVAYFGLAETVDVRTVGTLSDELVMRVRSSRPRLWRGMVFDHYDGTTWTRTSERPNPIVGLPATLPSPRPRGQRSQLIQTFEIVAPVPNLIFGAGDVTRVYHASQSVRQWADGTISVESTNDAGTLFSVVSEVTAADVFTLRSARGGEPDDVERWLQVPDTVTDRTRTLAAELIDPAASAYVNAEAVQTWIADHVSYSLSLDPYPRDADVVDHLLFERQVGWCEPIATSMVTLLRLGGVPARFATGFQPGSYNLLSGWWEVRANLAHAWVEVFVPGQGWVSFDPTGAVPEAAGTASVRVSWPLGEALGRLAEWLRSLPAGVLVTVILGAAVGVAGAVESRSRRRLRQPLAFLPGVAWEPSETAADLRARVEQGHPRADRGALATLVADHHARVTERAGPPSRDVRRALRRLRWQLRRDRLHPRAP